MFPPSGVPWCHYPDIPVTVSADFEPSKSGTERRYLVQIMRDAEIRWAKHCVWELVGLLVSAGVVTVVSESFAMLYS